jgi:hypothetical protein
MKVGMRRAEIAGKFVERFAPSESAVWNFEHAVFGIELVDRRAAAHRVSFAEDLLKVPLK